MSKAWLFAVALGIAGVGCGAQDTCEVIMEPSGPGLTEPVGPGPGGGQATDDGEGQIMEPGGAATDPCTASEQPEDDGAEQEPVSP